MGVTRNFQGLGKGVINPSFAPKANSCEPLGHLPGVYTEHSSSFVGEGDQRSTSSKRLCFLSNLTLKEIQKSVGHLTTSWSHDNTLAEGSCLGIDGKNSLVGPSDVSFQNDVIVPHEIPDMWQFSTAIGKGNHNNTPYNVLCCGEPPNFFSQLQRLSRFRRHNPYSAINFTFVVPLDPTAAWWPMLPGSQVPTTNTIVLTYNDHTTVPAALF